MWETVKKHLKWILPVAALVLLGWMCLHLNSKVGSMKEQLQWSEQNYIAARDTIEYIKLENGQLLAEKAGFVLSENLWANELDLSKKEIDELKKKLGSKIDHITEVRTEVRVDTVYMESEPVYFTQDSVAAPFKYEDDWLKVSGFHTITKQKSLTRMDEISMDVPLVVGITENNSFFATSRNPYVHITDIQGVTSTRAVPKKKHWGIGVNVGPGVYYDFLHRNVGLGIGAQVGVNYNF